MHNYNHSHLYLIGIMCRCCVVCVCVNGLGRFGKNIFKFSAMDPGRRLRAYPSLLMEELRDMVLGDVS